MRDDVIEIRRGVGRWWFVPMTVAFLAACVHILQLPDHPVRRFGGASAHVVAWVILVLLTFCLLGCTWALITRDHVVLRADVSGIVDRTRLAPMRQFAWTDIGAVTTRRVARRTLVRLRLVDGRDADLGWFDGRPEEVARRLEEARARWGVGVDRMSSIPVDGQAPE